MTAEKRKYLVGYEIMGHLSIDATNPQAAAAEAIGIVGGTARSLEAHGDVEYRVPFGRILQVIKSTRVVVR